MAMPPHEPTDIQRGQVSAFVSYGLPYREIARQIGIHYDTLRKHYKEELDYGKQIASAKVARTLFAMATVDRNVTAAIFWLKAQAGWSERTIVENVDGDKKRIRRDLSKLNREQKLQLAGLEAKILVEED